MCECPHGGEISGHLGPAVPFSTAYLWKRSNVGHLVFSAEDRGEGGGTSTKTTFTLVLVRGPQTRLSLPALRGRVTLRCGSDGADKRPGVSFVCAEAHVEWRLRTFPRLRELLESAGSIDLCFFVCVL